jgi:hypothetical protein
LAKLVPLHDLPKRERDRLGVLRGGGRPRKIATVPVVTETDYHEAVETLREEWIDADAVVRSQRDPQSEPIGRIGAIEQALGQEAAGLLWDRIQLQRRGTDASGISRRRIDAFAKLASVIVARAKVGLLEDLGPQDLRIRKVAGVFLDEVGIIAKETLPPKQAGDFMRRLGEVVARWSTGD